MLLVVGINEGKRWGGGKGMFVVLVFVALVVLIAMMAATICNDFMKK
jgi:hypothetical protein